MFFVCGKGLNHKLSIPGNKLGTEFRRQDMSLIALNLYFLEATKRQKSVGVALSMSEYLSLKCCSFTPPGLPLSHYLFRSIATSLAMFNTLSK